MVRRKIKTFKSGIREILRKTKTGELKLKLATIKRIKKRLK